MAEDFEAIADDVEAELDFVLVDCAIRGGIGSDALLETVELSTRLAYGPDHVVARHLAQRLLAIEYRKGHADPHQREDYEAYSQRGLYDSKRIHDRTRCSQEKR